MRQFTNKPLEHASHMFPIQVERERKHEEGKKRWT
jgi:hypothetical protein